MLFESAYMCMNGFNADVYRLLNRDPSFYPPPCSFSLARSLSFALCFHLRDVLETLAKLHLFGKQVTFESRPSHDGFLIEAERTCQGLKDDPKLSVNPSPSFQRVCAVRKIRMLNAQTERKRRETRSIKMHHKDIR